MYSTSSVLWLFTSDITYDVWYSFFTASFTQVFTTLTLIAILAHARDRVMAGADGLRQVPGTCACCCNLLSLLLLAAYVIYGSIIVWGVVSLPVREFDASCYRCRRRRYARGTSDFSVRLMSPCPLSKVFPTAPRCIRPGRYHSWR